MFFKNKELIAENQRLEKELAAYQTVQEELREEMLYMELNAEGRIRAINDLYAQATGFKISELEGKSLDSLMDPPCAEKIGHSRHVRRDKNSSPLAWCG